MLDLKMIRTEPDKVKAAIQKREMNLDSVIDEILKIDVDRRAVTGKVEAKKAEQNAASKQIPAMKKAGQDTTELMAQMRSSPRRSRSMTRSWASWRKSRRT